MVFFCIADTISVGTGKIYISDNLFKFAAGQLDTSVSNGSVFEMQLFSKKFPINEVLKIYLLTCTISSLGTNFIQMETLIFFSISYDNASVDNTELL